MANPIEIPYSLFPLSHPLKMAANLAENKHEDGRGDRGSACGDKDPGAMAGTVLQWRWRRCVVGIGGRVDAGDRDGHGGWGVLTEMNLEVYMYILAAIWTRRWTSTGSFVQTVFARILMCL
jgi:hypothetical protein